MKKFLVVLAAAVLVAGLCGQANAFFYYGTSQTDLIRVVYQTTASGGTYEEATDLGSITAIEQDPGSLKDTGYDLTAGAGGAYSFPSAVSASNLYVAYFATNGSNPTTGTEYWTSGPSTGTLTNNGGAGYRNNVWPTTQSVLTYYENTTTGAGTANVWASLSVGHSFYKGLGGTYDGYLLNGGLGTASLPTALRNPGPVRLESGINVRDHCARTQTRDQLSG